MNGPVVNNAGRVVFLAGNEPNSGDGSATVGGLAFREPIPLRPFRSNFGREGSRPARGTASESHARLYDYPVSPRGGNGLEALAGGHGDHTSTGIAAPKPTEENSASGCSVGGDRKPFILLRWLDNVSAAAANKLTRTLLGH